MLAFYWRWLKTAFRHSLGAIDLWTGLAGSVLGLIDHFWPDMRLMTAYGWQIPVWGLVSIMMMRLLLAPYWMWQEDEARRPAISISEGRKRLTALRGEGVAIRNQGENLKADLPRWLAQVEKWEETTIEAINAID